MLALSLEMGGTHIACGVVRDKELLGSTSLDSELGESLESLLPYITATLNRILKECGTAAEECYGVAVGFPGVVDVRNGRILSTLKNTRMRCISISSNGQWSTSAFAFELKMMLEWPCLVNNIAGQPKAWRM